MPIFTLEASPPEYVEIELRDHIVDLGAGRDAYICGHCAHVVATGGEGGGDGATSVTAACPGCGWVVRVPAAAAAGPTGETPRDRDTRRGSAAGGAG